MTQLHITMGLFDPYVIIVYMDGVAEGYMHDDKLILWETTYV